MIRPSFLSLNAKANAAISSAALLLTLAIAAGPVFAQAEAPAGAKVVAAGKADYLENCADCHGKSGQGGGPNMNVIPRMNPANLTTIAARNGGTFPAQQVADSIDGRAQVPSHKRFDMPFWGVKFQEEGKEFTPESEAKAKARIDAIVAYIKTLQVK